jgi:hypothetical protein
MVCKRVLALVFLIASPCLGQGDDEPLKVVAQAVRYDTSALVVHFELEFNRPPDFFTLDPAGRQADSWQIGLDTIPGNNGMGGTSPYIWETIIRGEEIHIGNNIRIRDHILGPSLEPTSGGWGPIAASVPYTLSGTTQTFSAPFSALNTTTGQFRYQLELYHYGDVLSPVIRRDSVPVPAPAVTAVLGLAGLVASRRRRCCPNGQPTRVRTAVRV